MTVRPILASLAAMLVLASCDSPEIPGANSEETAAAGVYVLTAVDGQAVPTTSAKDNLNCTRGVDGGSVTLATGPQNYTMVVNVRSVCDAAAGPQTTTAAEGETGHWGLSGGVFTMSHFATGNPITIGSPTYVVPSITISANLTWNGGAPVTKSLKFVKQ